MDILTLQNYLKEAEEKQYAEKHEFKEALKYYHADQLPDDVRAKVEQRGQPPQFENIFAMLSDKILGFKLDEEIDVGVLGRQKEDNDLAIIIQNIIKAIYDHKDFKIAQNELDLNLSFGIAVAKVWVKDRINKNNDNDKERVIKIKSIDPRYFYIDPKSKLSDASDSEYFHHKMMIRKELAERYFGSAIKKVVPKRDGYAREYVSIVESWVKNYKTDNWDRYVWSDNVLIKSEKSVFRHGKHPFVIQKLKIDHKNRAYGFFRNLKPIIDSINYQENRAMNMISSKSIIIEADAVDDMEEFVEQISLDNGVSVVRSGALREQKVQINQVSSNLVALNQKTAEKKQSAQRLIGFNEEMLGLANNRMSATAMEHRSNAGMISLALYIEASHTMLQNIASKCIDNICHYFDKEQVFKIVDKNDFTHYFTINEAVEEDGKMVVRNKIKIGGYDIVLYIKPASLGDRDERFKYWSELVKTFTSTDPVFAKRLLPLMFEDAQSSVYRDVKELLEQEIAREEQMQQQLQNSPEAKRMELENQLLETKIEKNNAEAAVHYTRADYNLRKDDLQGERADLE